MKTDAMEWFTGAAFVSACL